MTKNKFCPPLLLLLALISAAPVFARKEAVTHREGLAGALRAVMSHHPAIKGKQAEVEASTAEIKAAEAGRYPTLSAQAGYHDDDTRQGLLRAQQPLWAFGKITAPIKRAEARLAAEKADLLRVRRELMEETALAYARIDGIRRREEIAAGNVAAHVELFEQIDRRFDGKMASRADVMIAASRRTQAEAELEQIRGELRIALNHLEILTREAVDAAPPVPGHLTLLPSPAEIVPAILAASPDRALASREVEVARMGVKVQQAAAMPTLYAAADQTLHDQLKGLGETRLSLNLEGSLSGMGFADHHRVNSARARTEAARRNLDTVNDDLTQRTAELVSNLQLQRALEKSRRQSVEALAATYASYERQYAAGHKAWLDLLNMQRELTQQRLQLVQSENEMLRLSLRLVAQMGGLDELAGVQPK